MSWWQYLMLVNIYLLLFYTFYVILLSRETFFQLNRVYLVAAAILSFLIPVIQANWVKSLFITQRVKYTIYSSPVMFYQFKPIHDTHVTIGQILVYVYVAGIVFLAGKFVLQLISLYKVINQPQPSVAYSFFNKIRLGNNLENNAVITTHENVHASQWHSADVLLIEAVMIINWFNPVVYFYRFAIKHIHEYIADRQAIKAGTSREDYALLLLSQTFNAPAHQLVNPFFTHSLLKQRIMMMQKSNSQHVALIKYGLSAPLFILMLVLSSATVNNSKPVRLFNKKAEQVFLTLAAVDSSNVTGDDISGKPPGNTTVAVLPPPVQKSPFKDSTKSIIFTSVEQVPEFPGGLTAFGQYLGRNIRYPAKSRDNGVQGRVIISFVVEKDGSLSKVHVARGIDSSIDNEALRVINLSPRWTPGIQNGRPVRVQYSVPIAFTLSDEKNQPAEIKAVGVTSSTEPDLKDTIKKTTELHLTGSAEAPLYILDGKIVINLNSIDPKDIQSVTVLKSREATSLYGSKGASGVVVVTTKKISKPFQIKLQQP